MQHKLYNLDSKQTFLGIDMSDIMVGITTWLLGNFLAGEFLPPRLRMLAIFAGVGLAFLVLAVSLPLEQVVGLVGGTTVVIGLVLARLRREVAGNESLGRVSAKA